MRDLVRRVGPPTRYRRHGRDRGAVVDGGPAPVAVGLEGKGREAVLQLDVLASVEEEEESKEEDEEEKDSHDDADDRTDR